MIINHQTIAELFTGFKRNFRSGFESFGVDRTWDKFATLVPSSTEQELYAWLEEFPQMREWLGSRRYKDVETEDYRIVNRLWEATVAVKRTKIEDDTFGTYSPIFTEMGASAGRHGDELMYDVLRAGDGTFAQGGTGVGFDGVTFFNAAHPVGVGTVSNLNTAGGGNGKWYLMDARRPIKPLIYQQRLAAELESKTDPAASDDVFNSDRFAFGSRARDAGGYGFWQMAFQSDQPLNEANFDAAVAAMMGVESDKGMKLGISPSILAVGLANRAAALDLLGLDRLASGATNRNFQAVDLLITSYLP
jgi:phage major head subunit gpT-like protein